MPRAVGFEEGDAVGEAESGGVALGDFEGGWGDVGCVDFGGREFLWLGQPRMQPEPVPMSTMVRPSPVSLGSRAERSSRRPGDRVLLR